MAEAPFRGSHSQEGTQSKDRLTKESLAVERIADKVYRLMVADLRLERARGVRVGRRQRG